MKKEPALVCTYGPSGSGKTTDLGYSFPNAVFIAARGALQPVRSLCGYEPHTMEAQIMDDATKFLEKLSKVKDHDFDAVVVDDFSFLAEQQFAVYDKRCSPESCPSKSPRCATWFSGVDMSPCESLGRESTSASSALIT